MTTRMYRVKDEKGNFVQTTGSSRGKYGLIQYHRTRYFLTKKQAELYISIHGGTIVGGTQ